MNRASILTGGLLVFSSLLVAAWSQADDTAEPGTNPQPLFAPPDSIRLMPPGDESGGNVSIESKDELYERLRQSLLNLEERLQTEEQSVVVPEPPHAETTPDVSETGVATEDSDAQTEVEEPAVPWVTAEPTEEPHTHVDPMATDAHVEAESSHAEVEPIESPHASHLALETHGSPNLAALADNLYALGEYQLSLSTYEQLDLASLPVEEQIWVTYQMAGCLRHLDQTSEAARLYRQLLASYADHDLAGMSAWWLDTMVENSDQAETTARIRDAVERSATTVRDTVSRIQEASNADEAP